MWQRKPVAKYGGGMYKVNFTRSLFEEPDPFNRCLDSALTDKQAKNKRNVSRIQ
ncbi:hypothetical protein SAMN06269250_3246 [Spirosoma fluviale]|uniref:Uncharacterized protein n=1 Tax=Spirosoma fluviale TaxID=1597977 RepID=A0A286G397_9BACT|nr:hypothetical protein SAMN06269250_3246 [Spirosoma fluviale]